MVTPDSSRDNQMNIGDVKSGSCTQHTRKSSLKKEPLEPEISGSEVPELKNLNERWDINE